MFVVNLYYISLRCFFDALKVDNLVLEPSKNIDNYIFKKNYKNILQTVTKSSMMYL